MGGGELIGTVRVVNAVQPNDDLWSGPTHDFPFPVEAGHVLAFLRAIGETDPQTVAPPTFAAATDHFDPHYLRRPPRGSGWGNGLPESNLHVEQHFDYARPVHVGEMLTARKGPGRRWSKTGRSGVLQFVEERTELRDSDGDAVVVMRWVDVHAERSHADLTKAQLDRVRVVLPPGAVVVAEQLSRTQFVMYAGASGDFHPLHHDEDLARRHGYPSVFAPGMLTMALTARALTDLVGHERLRSFGGRFRSQVWPGDTLHAIVTEHGATDRPDAAGSAFTVTTYNQNGGLVFEATATTR